MTDPPPDRFATHFDTLALDAQTLQLGHGETIVPEAYSHTPEPIDALRTLPRLGTGTAPGTTIDLQMIGTLGEGGMGLVRLARQVALNRDVAVKTLRSNSDEAAPKLLQEAYVTGRLEHPNIVPIYTLGRDDSGAPLIVMKRIEGVAWLDVLRDPDAAPGAAEPDLMWHLEVLLHLCNAVRYAHRHGVIHRDIKPENVMIGQFGEVYLLDWGIAVSIADPPSDTDALPHRDDVIGMAGTPAYMAPEMTQDRATEHDTRTDIYLLGALLHEILTGKPRHAGKNLFDVLRSAFENKPVDFSDDVPAELGAIANRAMATDREDRFQSVEDFRGAILDYIEHRGALELIAEAQHLLDRIADLTATQDGEHGDDEDREFAIHDLFTECRFACQQAVRSWPESPQARDVQRRYLQERFNYAIARRDVVQARSVAAQMEELGLDVADARAKIDAAVAERESQAEELRGLRALAADSDLSRGRLSRSLAMMLVGLMWAAETAYAWFQRRAGDAPNLDTAYVDGTWRVLAIGAIGLLLFRKPLFSTAANRRLTYLIILTLASLVVFRGIYMIRPEDIFAARAFEVGMYGVAGTAGGLLVDDLRISALGALYFPMALVTAWIGPDSGIILSVVHILVFFGAGYLWTPRQLARRITI